MADETIFLLLSQLHPYVPSSPPFTLADLGLDGSKLGYKYRQSRKGWSIKRVQKGGGVKGDEASADVGSGDGLMQRTGCSGSGPSAAVVQNVINFTVP
jgi:hypothetical protein